MNISNLSRMELDNIIMENLRRYFGEVKIVMPDTVIFQESYVISISEMDEDVISQLNRRINDYDEVAVHSGEVVISADSYFVSMVTNVGNTALLAIILINSITNEAQILHDFL